MLIYLFFSSYSKKVDISLTLEAMDFLFCFVIVVYYCTFKLKISLYSDLLTRLQFVQKIRIIFVYVGLKPSLVRFFFLILFVVTLRRFFNTKQQQQIQQQPQPHHNFYKIELIYQFYYRFNLFQTELFFRLNMKIKF